MGENDHRRFMCEAIEHSRRAVGTPDRMPFAALIVRDGKVVGRGINMVKGRFDPTAHGEVEAIRDACANLRTTDLSDCELYTSAEPCALCVSAMVLARIPRYHYGSSLDQSEASMAIAGAPKGVDPYDLRSEAGSPVELRRMAGTQMLADEAQAVITDWARALAQSRG